MIDTAAGKRFVDNSADSEPLGLGEGRTAALVARKEGVYGPRIAQAARPEMAEEEGFEPPSELPR